MKKNGNKDVLHAYFNYLNSEEGTIVFIVKNLVDNLDTKKKWIDVVNFDSWGSKGNKFAFNYFIIELFDRKIHPIYPSYADTKLRKAITWQTAHQDIEKQRRMGISGPKFLITCHLYNKNRGKKITKSFDNWNAEFGGFDFTGLVPTTTITKLIDMEPEWVYRITGLRKINDKRVQYIQKNYDEIYERILDEKRVKIEWFFES